MPIHFGASLTLGFLHLVLATVVQTVLRGAEPYPFLPKLVDNFAASYHWNLLIYWAIVALVHARDYARDAQEHRRARGGARDQRRRGAAPGADAAAAPPFPVQHAERDRGADP